MLVHTQQTKDVYATLIESGVYVANPLLSKFYSDYHNDSFKRGYDWISANMRNCIKDKPESIPVFLWGGSIPDTEEVWEDSTDYIETLKNSVNIVLDIPEDLLFGTDFDLYHCILNNSSCNREENEEDQSYEEIVKSWNSTIVPKEKWDGYDRRIQFTTWRLLKEWIVSVSPAEYEIISYDDDEEEDY